MLMEIAAVISPAERKQLQEERLKKAAERRQEQLKRAAAHRGAALERRRVAIEKRKQPPLYDPTVRPPGGGSGQKIDRPRAKPIGRKGRKMGPVALKGLGQMDYATWYRYYYLQMLQRLQQYQCPTGYVKNASGQCVPTQQPWYYNQQYQAQYNPYQQQQCPPGCSLATQPGVSQAYCYDQYGRMCSQQQSGYGQGYMTAQQCVARGGIYDSFTGQCSSPTGVSQYQSPYYGYGYGAMSAQQCVAQGGLWDSFTGQCSRPGQAVQATGTMPNVLGTAKWTAVQMLNNAGYNVWLLSENGIPQGSPTNYDAKRVQIVVTNGVVTATQNG